MSDTHVSLASHFMYEMFVISSPVSQVYAISSVGPSCRLMNIRM